MNTPNTTIEDVLKEIKAIYKENIYHKDLPPAYKEGMDTYNKKLAEHFATSLNRQVCRWTKASEFEYKPRQTYFAKWEAGYPKGFGIKSTGFFQESDGTFFWHVQGFVPVGASEHKDLYILDESIEPCATSSENYWKQRCEAAEAYAYMAFSKITGVMSGDEEKLFNEWQQLKNK